MPLTCYHSTMSNVQVKNLPDDLHEQLRARAAEHHATISDYVLELIRRDLQRPTRRAWIHDVLSTPKLSPSPSDAADMVSSVRSERDDELARRLR